MAIDRVSLRLQSETLTAAELADLAGGPPTSAAERGSLVSSRHPSGPVHAVTTIVYGASVDGDGDLGSFVVAYRIIVTSYHSQCLSISNRKDPRRQAAVALKPVNTLPYYHHRITHDLFDNMWFPDQIRQKTTQSRKIIEVQFLKSANIAPLDAVDQLAFKCPVARPHASPLPLRRCHSRQHSVSLSFR